MIHNCHNERLQAFVRFEDTANVSVVTKQGDAMQQRTYLEVTGGPHAFQIGTPENGSVNPHFHRVDQFQFIFGGVGANYKYDPIEEGHGLLHYADAYSTYGPIQAGRKPMDFVTLRARLDHMIAYMPEDRADLIQTPRHRNVRRDVCLDAARTSAGSEVLFEYEDRLAAYRVWAASGQDVSIPDVTGTSGQYCYVLNGSVICGGETFGPRAVGWIGPSSGRSFLTAGDDGTDLLVLQFPNPTAEPEDTQADVAMASNH